MYKIILINQIELELNKEYDNKYEYVVHISETKNYLIDIFKNKNLGQRFIDLGVKYVLGHNDSLLKYYNIENINFIYLPFHNGFFTDPIRNIDYDLKIQKKKIFHI